MATFSTLSIRIPSIRKSRIQRVKYDFDHFCIEDAKDHPDDPDALTSGRADGHQDIRDGFGSTLFRYTRELGAAAYDPISGQNTVTVPARQHMYSIKGNGE